jgi:hypothetical protein
MVLAHSDFPGGDGESRFTGRANADDVQTSEARQALGLEPFADSSSMVTIEANRILF